MERKREEHTLFVQSPQAGSNGGGQALCKRRHVLLCLVGEQEGEGLHSPHLLQTVRQPPLSLLFWAFSLSSSRFAEFVLSEHHRTNNEIVVSRRAARHQVLIGPNYLFSEMLKAQSMP